jgi:hypothetical protein
VHSHLRAFVPSDLILIVRVVAGETFVAELRGLETVVLGIAAFLVIVAVVAFVPGVVLLFGVSVFDVGRDLETSGHP